MSDCYRCRLVDKCITELESEVSALKESVRWIPCSERLPEPGVNVLVWDWIFKKTVLAYVGKITKTDWWGTGHMLSCPPKEWMPLPLPPVEQEKADEPM